MSRKLVATLCLGLASIGNAADEAAATDLVGAGDMQTVTSLTGANGWSGDVDTGMASITDPAWLVRHAADPEAEPWQERPRGAGFATHRAIDLGGLQGGATAAFNFDFEPDGGVLPVHRGDPADWLNASPGASSATLGGAVGLQFGPIQAGPFSTLTYARSGSFGGLATDAWEPVDQLVTGSVGLQATTQFDSVLGPSDTQFRLSLDQDLFVERGTVDSALDPWRRNIFVEEVDASEFDFENAIVFLKHRGRVPGWFFYEARVRVRTTGIKAITGRIWIKW